MHFFLESVYIGFKSFPSLLETVGKIQWPFLTHFLSASLLDISDATRVESSGG
jgi:hypothetical protein